MGTIEKTFNLKLIVNNDEKTKEDCKLKFSDRFLNKDGVMVLKDEYKEQVNETNPRFRKD